MTRLKAGLYMVSTPIGNLGDMSARAVEVLSGANAVACEDTRVSGKLLAHFGIKAERVFAVYDHNESARAAEIVEMIKGGAAVALISDSGTPVVSDPGFKVVRAVVEAGLYMTAVPGPSAVINAFLLSALPSDKFCFAGFAPRGEKALLEFFAGVNSTTIFYESPARLTPTLGVLAKALPTAQVAVAREMTKMFEEVVRGTPSEVLAHFKAHPAKGEIAVALSPPPTKPLEDWKKLAPLYRAKLSAKDAAELMAKTFGVSKKEVYGYMISLDSPANPPIKSGEENDKGGANA